MGLELQTVQHLVTALLNLAVAVLAGASVCRLWLGRGASGWAEARRRPARNAALGGAAVALVANLVLLWLESAAMAEVPLTEAAGATWSMLSATHLGSAWSIGMAGLAVATAGVFIRDDRSSALPTLAALCVFWYTRSMVSHAASEGDFSVSLLADWVHLGLASLWVGEVLLSGGVMLKAADNMSTADRRARAAYVVSLSNSATFALAGIFITGLYTAWRNLGGFDNLVGNPYGNTLTAKLLLVGAAAMLGGFNRFFVMPPWLARESAANPPSELLPARFRRILRIEALVLLAVVVVAAWLASTSPPQPRPSRSTRPPPAAAAKDGSSTFAPTDSRSMRTMSPTRPTHAKKWAFPIGLAHATPLSSAGYAIEGHVPAAEIKRLLATKPKAKGLAVPAMPPGSPGMEGPTRMPYDVLLVRNDGSTTVYKHYD
jgi:putative copper resistance protein D